MQYSSYGRITLVGQGNEKALYRLGDESTPLVVCKIALNFPLCRAEQCM
jgi:hypothetical protein